MTRRFRAEADGSSGPLHALPGRVARRIGRDLTTPARRWLAGLRPATIADEAFDALLAPARERGMDPLDWSHRLVDAAAACSALAPFKDVPDGAFRHVAKEAGAHRVDLLGSGPVEVGFRAEAAGAFGGIYHMAPGPEEEKRQIARMSELLEVAASFTGDDSAPLKRLLAALSDAARPYRPIDWHLDFKSGYRWFPGMWYMEVPYGHLPGVDIKVPWELSRCHHLVALALDGATGGPRQQRADEIGLQILDWIAANPPRFGVNWRSAMDVAIRAANWVWTVPIIGGADVLPPALLWVLAKSLYQHGVHIESHLDYATTGTNNHYLADLTGLLHIASAFPEFPESPAWTALCLQELASEMRRTVGEDGASYEGSTGYHRLVTEMFLHASLVAVRLTEEQRTAIARAGKLRRRRPEVASRKREYDLVSPEVFPVWYWDRLERMVGFTALITKPNGLAPQFGDQDNGRFLKLEWANRSVDDFEEESRDHRHVIAVGGAVFGRDKWQREGAGYLLDASLATACVPVGSLDAVRRTSERADVALAETFVTGESESVWYPSGGVCVMHSGEFWVAVRCLGRAPGAPTGHRHNDQLSFELNVGGIDFIVDPGTGTYTADPQTRNAFRATATHSTVEVPGREQNPVRPGLQGLFALPDGADARAVETLAMRFAGEHRGFGAVHSRTFDLNAERLLVDDYLDVDSASRVVCPLAPGVRVSPTEASERVVLDNHGVSLAVTALPPASVIRVVRGAYSPAYGTVQPAPRLEIDRHSPRTTIEFRTSH